MTTTVAPSAEDPLSQLIAKLDSLAPLSVRPTAGLKPLAIRVASRMAELERDVAEARAAILAMREAQWRPIKDSGPVKDSGDEVLLWLASPYSRVAKARWFEPWGNWREDAEDPRPSDEYSGIGENVPSHFMPLPSPPTVEG